jgi:hypothetical protein
LTSRATVWARTSARAMPTFETDEGVCADANPARSKSRREWRAHGHRGIKVTSGRSVRPRGRLDRRAPEPTGYRDSSLTLFPLGDDDVAALVAPIGRPLLGARLTLLPRLRHYEWLDLTRGRTSTARLRCDALPIAWSAASLVASLSSPRSIALANPEISCRRRGSCPSRWPPNFLGQSYLDELGR